MSDNKVLIEVSVTGNAEIQFKKLSESVARFSADAKKSFFDAGRIFDNFVANLASSAVTGAFDLIQSGFAQVNDVISQSIKAASEQEDAVNKLNSALKLSGEFSAQTSADLQKYAESLQSTTKFSDETILSTTALISSLSQLDKEGLKGATKAALDLSAALSIDLESAAKLVGKAAAGEVGTLKRYGVEVKDTGDKARDFAAALEEINRKFGGSAAAQVNTFSGAMALLKNQYGEVLETIGDTIIKSPGVIEAFKIIGERVNDLTRFLKDNQGGAQALVEKGFLLLIDSIRATVLAANVLTTAFQAVTGVFQQALEVMIKINIPLAILSKFSDQARDLKTALIELADGGIEKVKQAFAGENGFAAVDAVLVSIRDRMVEVNDITAKGGAIAQEVSNTKKLIASEEAIVEEARKQNAIINQETEQSTALNSYATYLFQRNEALKKFDTEEAKQAIASNNAKLEQIRSATALSAQKKIEIGEKLAEAQRQIEEKRAREQLDTLGRISTLSTAKTKELAFVGKTAAVALATIDTYKGANSALGSVPFPFNFAAAAAVIAAGLVNVSNIVGTPLATGITQVPAGFQNDTFPARLTSGERVVSAPQNRDLTEFLAGSTGLTAKLDQLIAVLSLNGGRTTINIGGQEIIGAIQNELDSGRVLNV